MKEVIWQDKLFSVVDEKTTDARSHCLKLIDSGFEWEGCIIQYNEITKQIQWRFKAEDYHLSPLDIAIIKNAIMECQSEEMFDFSNYTNNISQRWCAYLRYVNYSIGSRLANSMPWPFVIAIIKLLLEEIYNEGLIEG